MNILFTILILTIIATVPTLAYFYFLVKKKKEDEWFSDLAFSLVYSMSLFAVSTGCMLWLAWGPALLPDIFEFNRGAVRILCYVALIATLLCTFYFVGNPKPFSPIVASVFSMLAAAILPLLDLLLIIVAILPDVFLVYALTSDIEVVPWIVLGVGVLACAMVLCFWAECSVVEAIIFSIIFFSGVVLISVCPEMGDNMIVACLFGPIVLTLLASLVGVPMDVTSGFVSGATLVVVAFLVKFGTLILMAITFGVIQFLFD